MGIKIDGKALAEQHTQNLITKLQKLKADRDPKIVSFCNTEDEPSVKYTQMKAAKAEEVGITFIIEDYDTKTSRQTLRSLIEQYNQDSTVDGIMVQLPLPEHLVVFQQDLLELIDPKKDVDGLTEAGQQMYLPATVKSVISILNAEWPGWEHSTIAVVGSTGEVGRPLVKVLQEQLIPIEAQKLVQIDRDQGDLNTDLKDCDIVISATGQEHLIKPEMIQPQAGLIDVGLGDFDPACYDQASKYTGKYGGVGPMTVISLMENLFEAFVGSDHSNVQ